jgi:hypothetical protein
MKSSTSADDCKPLHIELRRARAGMIRPWPGRLVIGHYPAKAQASTPRPRYFWLRVELRMIGETVRGLDRPHK